MLSLVADTTTDLYVHMKIGVFFDDAASSPMAIAMHTIRLLLITTV